MLRLEDTQYTFRKKWFKLVGGEFRVLDRHGRLVFFSQQKALRLREDIRVYGDERKTEELLSITTHAILDFSAAYDVVDSGSLDKIGTLRRKGFRSFLRDEWEILDPLGEVVGQIREDSLVLALLRRMVTSLIPQRYDFVLHGANVASFQGLFNPFAYRATLDLSRDVRGLLDRRLALAAGLLLMAIEGQQE